MKLRTTTLALAAMILTCSACQTADEAPAGNNTAPLTLGQVSIGTPATATRDGGATRADIAQNPTGYTGIRKTQFIAGDQLALNLDDTATGGSATRAVTATLGADGSWTLGSAPVYVQSSTVITATHAAAEQTPGIGKDHLAATAADCTLSGSVLSVAMKHAGSMIDITTAATGITDIKVNGTLITTAEDETAAAVTTTHHRTIVPAATAVTYISATKNGTAYEATLTTPIAAVANKRYPIILTFQNNNLTATVGTTQDWTDGGTFGNVPAGYTRVISTPEDLAQFAKDVNDGVADAISAIVYQTADIDMSQLKTAAEANAAAGVTTYTYLATKDEWEPIGNDSQAFTGKYNGNGYTISHLTFTTYRLAAISVLGFFGTIEDAALTGIHLRDFMANNKNAGIQGYGGTLIGEATNSVIALCSATGTLKGTASLGSGGLIGRATDSHITRCTVRVIMDIYDASGGDAGLIAELLNANSRIAGCSVVNNITAIRSSGGITGEFSRDVFPFGCYCGGSVLTNTGNNYVHYGATSCYSDMTAAGGFGYAGAPPYPYTDCAYTLSNKGTYTGSGVTVDVLPAAAYAVLTASDATLANVKTLHWSPTDGYTLTEVTKTWRASKVWKNNPGAAPTIDFAYEGE